MNFVCLFVMEGVSYYLGESIIRSILNFVGSCSLGSSIVLDYSTSDFVSGDHSSYGGKKVAKWLTRINQPFRFGLNEDEFVPFLANNNLIVKSHYSADQLQQIYLGGRGGISTRTLGHLRFAHACVAAQRIAK